MRIKTKMILEYLQGLPDEKKVTSEEVALATGLTRKQVDGSFTSGIKAAGYGYREPDQIQDEEGRWVNVKYLVLTDEGRNLDLTKIEAKK